MTILLLSTVVKWTADLYQSVLYTVQVQYKYMYMYCTVQQLNYDEEQMLPQNKSYLLLASAPSSSNLMTISALAQQATKLKASTKIDLARFYTGWL